MTPQEIFDKAVGGVIAQGKLAIDPNRGCAYRTEDGAACVVGQLIDAETAKEWDEFNDPDPTIMSIAHSHLGIPEEMEPHLKLLAELQSAHDGAYRVNHRNDAKEIQDFIEAARQVALRNGLEFKFG